MATDTTTPQMDVRRGTDALVFFHNQALKYPDNYRLSFDELKNTLQEQSHGAFLDGFGFAINSVNLDDTRVKAAMISLADAGQGRLPASWNGFFTALQSEATKIRFADAANEVLKGTARDIVAGVEEVGKVTVKTLQNAGGLITMLPLLAFVALAGYAFMKVKRA